ncbi:hypothetical protein AUK22_00560 [bacterium CG2_30_54_10]|nr:MAG: hypothetical protein AUK22_00560 [bacterium CG2_30_54_10]
MTKEEFQVYYKKNKVLVIGVPIILGILLLDMLVLRPARQRAKQPGQPAASPVNVVDAANAAGASSIPAVDPLAPPPPLSVPGIPPLSSAVEKRFLAAESYPYPPTKNIFLPEIKAEAPVAIVPEVAQEMVYERPNLTFNGFFVMGPDRVAIVKMNDRLMLARAGQRLQNTPFMLKAIHPDRIEIVDTQDQGREFEVAISENSSVAITAKAN